MRNHISSAALIYLSQTGSFYHIAADPGYCIQRRPALGLQYLSAVLEKRGVKTSIFDQSVDNFTLEWLIEKLRAYDLAGFYCSDALEKTVKEFCRRIKSKLDIPILVGGPSALGDTSFLSHGCDIVVHGEGEATIQQIVDYYGGRLALGDVRGISYSIGGKAITSPAQALIKNLDEIPFPDRSKININSYYDYLLFTMRKPYVTMITSRGCIYSCYFCASCKQWGSQYRRRSVDNVLAEIKELVEKYRVRYISFQDDVFITSNGWVEEFCAKLAERRFNLRWFAILHPFSIPSGRERVLRLMKQAGCDAFSCGLQSAHPEILKGINRHPQEPEKLRELLRIARKLDLITVVFYIFGLPHDTRETIKATIDYSLRCGSTLAYHLVFTMLKGSELERLYPDKKVCFLSKEEIRRLAASAAQRFYINPGNLMRISRFILKNPAWLFHAGLQLPSLLSRAGLLARQDNLPGNTACNSEAVA